MDLPETTRYSISCYEKFTKTKANISDYFTYQCFERFLTQSYAKSML